MATPPLDQKEAEDRILAVEQALTEGYPPPGVRPDYGDMGAILAGYLKRNPNGKRGSSESWLRAAIRAVGRNPDWSLYRAKQSYQRAQIEVPDGYRVKGTSTLYDAQTGEPKLEWVKTDLDQERQKEIFEEWLRAFTRDVPRIRKAAAPKGTDKDLMTGYPVGDHHLGMLAWAPEAGENYDIDIAERRLFSAVDYLVEASPPSETALFALLGDFLHYDSMTAETPTNRNPLDADGRPNKMIESAATLTRRCVERLREKHRYVHVIVARGNHDPYGTLWLMRTLATAYEKEPRVTVDMSPANYHYYQFGKNLIGIHHGDGAKLDKLPAIMAADQPKLWGETEHREWWTGDKHFKKTLDEDHWGCIVRQFPVLAPNDAWHHRQGYRSKKAMHAIVYQRDHGEQRSLTVHPGMMNG